LLWTAVSFHALAPPVGSVDVTMFPVKSAATHSEIDGQETSTSGL
jgi:hypothetical protein